MKRQVPEGGLQLGNRFIDSSLCKILIIDIYSASRNVKYWGDDAECFSPARWLNQKTVQDDANPAAPKGPGVRDCPAPKGAFLPFGFGKQQCIGWSYGEVELRTLVGEVVKHLKLVPAAKPTYCLRGPSSGGISDLVLKVEGVGCA